MRRPSARPTGGLLTLIGVLLLAVACTSSIPVAENQTSTPEATPGAPAETGSEDPTASAIDLPRPEGVPLPPTEGTTEELRDLFDALVRAPVLEIADRRSAVDLGDGAEYTRVVTTRSTGGGEELERVDTISPDIHAIYGRRYPDTSLLVVDDTIWVGGSHSALRGLPITEQLREQRVRPATTSRMVTAVRDALLSATSFNRSADGSGTFVALFGSTIADTFRPVEPAWPIAAPDPDDDELITAVVDVDPAGWITSVRFDFDRWYAIRAERGSPRGEELGPFDAETALTIRRLDSWTPTGAPCADPMERETADGTVLFCPDHPGEGQLVEWETLAWAALGDTTVQDPEVDIVDVATILSVVRDACDHGGETVLDLVADWIASEYPTIAPRLLGLPELLLAECDLLPWHSEAYIGGSTVATSWEGVIQERFARSAAWAQLGTFESAAVEACRTGQEPEFGSMPTDGGRGILSETQTGELAALVRQGQCALLEE